MHIQLYMQFYAGPDAPGSRQPREFVRTLASRGHHVWVIATDFNVDSEQPEPEEDLSFPGGGRLRVLRIPSARNFRASHLARMRTYSLFAAKALALGLRLPRPDVVVGSIQPLFTGHAALGVARAWRVPFVLEIRDLWPDALEVKGVVTGWKARPLYWMADVLYRAADRIVSITPGIRKELVKKGLDPRRIDVFPNGFDPGLFAVPVGTRERVRSELGWGDSFVALYTGTHTEVTAIDVIVRAAAVLKARTDIRFDLVGRGQTKKAAMALAADLGLTNIHFHDPVPKKRIPELLAAADVALMTLFRSPLIEIYFENKFVDFMGSGTPILAAMEGEQARILREQEAGRVVDTFDADGLAALVRDAANDFAPFRRMGENGRAFVRKNLLLDGILDRYAAVVEAVARRTGDAIPPWEPL